MLVYKHYKNREEWLKGRTDGIGASESATIVGASNWMTPSELWEIKTGRRKPKDMSDNVYVQYGTEAEKHIRSLFMLKHEEMELTYRPYDILYQDDRPWLRCTLDGELKTEDGEMGILEVKTHYVKGKSDYQQWNNRIPDNYYCQILHQFLATGFTFCYLTAELFYQDLHSTIKNYYFRREDHLEDMEWLLSEEEKFWESVQSGNSPPVKLIL